jgi:hypothetical protein
MKRINVVKGQDGRVVSAAAIIAVGVIADGRCDLVGKDIDPAAAEILWTGLLPAARPPKDPLAYMSEEREVLEHRDCVARAALWSGVHAILRE